VYEVFGVDFVPSIAAPAKDHLTSPTIISQPSIDQAHCSATCLLEAANK
jgi:hypothetical protein